VQQRFMGDHFLKYMLHSLCQSSGITFTSL
jgi:hypothetical protein